MKDVCFTCFDESVIEGLMNQSYLRANDVVYLLIHKELAPTTCRLHWHGLLVFKKRICFNKIRKFFSVGLNEEEEIGEGFEDTCGIIGGVEGDERPTPEEEQCRVHIESRKGTVEQAVSYICKYGSEFVYEYDSLNYSQEARVPIDWNNGDRWIGHNDKRTERISDNIVKRLKEGATTTDIDKKFPGFTLMHQRNIKEYLSNKVDPRRPKPIVFYLYGPTGCGKSASAIALGKMFRTVETPINYYLKNNDPWWEKYNNEMVVIFDDISETSNFRELLNILDHAPYVLKVKGASQYFTSRVVVITSDRPPEECFNRNSMYNGYVPDCKWDFLMTQWNRRITHIVHFDDYLVGSGDWRHKVMNLYSMLTDKDKDTIFRWKPEDDDVNFGFINPITGEVQDHPYQAEEEDEDQDISTLIEEEEESTNSIPLNNNWMLSSCPSLSLSDRYHHLP